MEWTPQIIVGTSWSELYLRNTKLGGTTIRIDNHIPSQTWSRSNVTLHHFEPPQSKFPHSLTSHRFRLCETCSSVDLFVFPRKSLPPFTTIHYFYYCIANLLLPVELLLGPPSSSARRCHTVTKSDICMSIAGRGWRTFNRKWTIVSWFSGRLCSLEWGAVVGCVRNLFPDLSVCLL